ncbi:MAG: hypothetical protein IJQ80_05900 [Clostridia bacterium]|nr:hypothetical protein [Clostridia bacterium]
MEILKICGTVILSAVIALILRQTGSPVALCVVTASCVVALSLCLPRIGAIVETVSGMIPDEPSSALFSTVLKITSAAIICEISADVCESAGETTLSKVITAAGRVEIIFLSLPAIGELMSSAVALCEV